MIHNEYYKALNVENLKLIEELFELNFSVSDNTYTFVLSNSLTRNSISIDIIFEKDNDNLISVYSQNSHLQLQSCKDFIISSLLEEIIFFTINNEKISAIIISKKGDCSLYANVDKSILRADFMTLHSEKLLSAVALSIIESN